MHLRHSISGADETWDGSVFFRFSQFMPFSILHVYFYLSPRLEMLSRSSKGKYTHTS